MDGTLSAANLLEQVLARYGSVDVFCAELHRLLDHPTTELPAVAESIDTGGRHRLR